VSFGHTAYGGLAFSPAGSTVVAMAGCELSLWDTATHASIGASIDLHDIVAPARGSELGCYPERRLDFTLDGSLVSLLGPAAQSTLVAVPCARRRKRVKTKTSCPPRDSM
jgi:hypothetical protein